MSAHLAGALVQLGLNLKLLLQTCHEVGAFTDIGYLIAINSLVIVHVTEGNTGVLTGQTALGKQAIDLTLVGIKLTVVAERITGRTACALNLGARCGIGFLNAWTLVSFYEQILFNRQSSEGNNGLARNQLVGSFVERRLCEGQNHRVSTCVFVILGINQPISHAQSFLTHVKTPTS